MFSADVQCRLVLGPIPVTTSARRTFGMCHEAPCVPLSTESSSSYEPLLFVTETKSTELSSSLIGMLS